MSLLGVQHAPAQRLVVCGASYNPPHLRSALKQRQQEYFRKQFQQRQEDWNRWEEQAATEEVHRRQHLQSFHSPQQGRASVTPPVDVGLPAQPLASSTPARATKVLAPSQTQKLQQQQQQFAAANQQVEQGQRAQDQLLADLQARMQKRVAERQKKSRRWLGGSATRIQQQQQQQQEEQKPPDWHVAVLLQQQGAGAGPSLNALARSELQQKVSRFAATVNFLQRSQHVRGAGLSWGRRQPAAGSAGAAEAAGPGKTGQDLRRRGWEQQLGVTRVRRQRGGVASTAGEVGANSLSSSLEVEEGHSSQQQSNAWRSPGQARASVVMASEEQLDW